MSGGQQQRVGLARALGRTARLYLFDEPTAHLDAPVRVAVEEEITRRRAETGAAALYATHDATEAMAVADRIALIRDGSLIQEGSPTVVYERPCDRWSAHLTGPVSSITSEVVSASEVTIHVAMGDSTVEVEAGGPPTRRTVQVLIRPEWVRPNGPVAGLVDRVAFRGPYTDYHLRTAMGLLLGRIDGPPVLAVGERTTWSVSRGWVPADRS